MKVPLVERRLWLAAMAMAALAMGMTAGLIWLPVETGVQLLAGGLGLVVLGVLGAWLIRRGLRPLASVTTVTEALRDGDFALRLTRRRGGVLAELATSLNELADELHRQSIASRESGLLLDKVLEEIDLPVFAFRHDGVLALSNPAARRLVGMRLHDGVTAAALSLDELLEDRIEESTRIVLPGGSGRFLVRRRSFRLGGVPHTMLVLAEVGSVLSAERNEAWQSLVRVMSHEINNSLSPIKSMAESWRTRALDRDRELDRQMLGENLDLISRRAASLSRFVGIYAGLAKLPEPTLAPVDVERLVAKVCALESRIELVRSGPPLSVELDADQIEQALINLLRNAVDAVSDRATPEVRVEWRRDGTGLVIDVVDNGPGPPESKNLFVPFFTTKSDGNGIGLLLVRRIAELHRGNFELLPRDDGEGAVARLWIPAS
ncbi:MAG: sensor histidine kinase [Candidatus Wenzhouxiangella sp. M2_3B_020]